MNSDLLGYSTPAVREDRNRLWKSGRQIRLIILVVLLGALLGLLNTVFVAFPRYRAALPVVEFDTANIHPVSAFKPVTGWWVEVATAETGTKVMTVQGQGSESIVAVTLPQAGLYHLHLVLSHLQDNLVNGPIRVYLNQTLLGELNLLDRPEAQFFALDIPSSVIHAGVNTLSFAYPEAEANYDRSNGFVFHIIRLEEQLTPWKFMVIVAQASFHLIWQVGLLVVLGLVWQKGWPTAREKIITSYPPLAFVTQGMLQPGQLVPSITRKSLALAMLGIKKRPVAVIAGLIFLSLSLPITFFSTYLSGYDGSGWVRSTHPLFYSTNWALGYAAVYYDNVVVHFENITYPLDVAMFAGGSVNPSSTFSVRGLHPFLGSFFTPFAGAVKSLVIVNYLYWALAACVAWRFTKRLFNSDLAALIAVVFVTGGIGWVTNVGDLSPHLASYAFYFLTTLILYESRVWQERRPFRIHLFLGFVLALAILNYQNGMVLLVLYAVVALRYNRLRHLVPAVLLGLSAQYIWALHLNLLNQWVNNRLDWIDFFWLNAHGFKDGILLFQQNINQPFVLLRQYLYDFAQLLLAIESLPLVILGLLSWFALPKKVALYWFFAMAFLLQVVINIPLSGWGAARGAYEYGATLLLVSPASATLAGAIRRRGLLRYVGLATLILVVCWHFYWSTAQFWGNLGPLSTYQATILDYTLKNPGTSVYMPKPKAMSLTGMEPTPQLYWGKASIIEAGALPSPAPLKDEFSFWRALLVRIPFFFYVSALLLAILYCLKPEELENLPPGKLILRLIAQPSFLSFIILWILFAGLSTVHNEGKLQGSYGVLQIPPGGSLKYTVQISDTFLNELAGYANEDVTMEVFTTGQVIDDGGYVVRFSLDDSLLFEKEGQGAFNIPLIIEDKQRFIEMLQQHRQMTIQLSPSKGSQKQIVMWAWQRAGLPGRTLETTFPLDASASQYLPALEVRVRSAQAGDRTLYLIGF